MCFECSEMTKKEKIERKITPASFQYLQSTSKIVSFRCCSKIILHSIQRLEFTVLLSPQLFCSEFQKKREIKFLANLCLYKVIFLSNLEYFHVANFNNVLQIYGKISVLRHKIIYEIYIMFSPITDFSIYLQSQASCHDALLYSPLIFQKQNYPQVCKRAFQS